MKLGIMQPYFFPYFQQFRHIAQCDQWIVFDTVHYSRKTWINRNRILDRKKGWSYISVPIIKGATRDSIANATLGIGPWREDILDHLRIYQNEAPSFDMVHSLVGEILFTPARTVGDLNTNVLRRICSCLGIGTPIMRLSEMELDLPPMAEAGHWALLISQALGASEYSNAPGGRALFDSELYQRSGVQLEFYQPIELRYSTGTFPFVPDLSVIDTLMWLSPIKLKGLLQPETTI
jgi:hypothetical protein